MTDQWGEMTNSGVGEMTMGRDDLIPCARLLEDAILD